MNTFFLLILLTQNAAGNVSASFVETANQEQCEVKQKLVEGIFTTARVNILESHCVPGQHHFNEFGHATSSASKRHFYWIDFNSVPVEITRISDWKSCMEREAAIAKTGFYCASSIQEQFD
ncbi:hypothetical protein [Sedimenticola hydrogenitrophicus]|uniref:hypothetical protein n=1 Tax=Sedimenticola hydrogenitrophicus TaxID=2967975 RepID=UPI0021A9118F|nr:hypothetical protein [Sedimenticola hydrogenitrophicus]